MLYTLRIKVLLVLFFVFHWHSYAEQSASFFKLQQGHSTNDRHEIYYDDEDDDDYEDDDEYDDNEYYDDEDDYEDDEDYADVDDEDDDDEDDNDNDEDEEIEKNYRPNYRDKAYGDSNKPSKNISSIWPVNVRSIGNTNATYQDYGTGAYFHHGIDIRADGGSNVVTSTGGKVVAIRKYGPSDLYWEVAIQDDEGYIWQYHHVDPNSITQAMRESLSYGTYVQRGTNLGKVARWPTVEQGERYDHVHINVIGAGGVYLNPMQFLPPLEDNTPPWVNRIALMQNGRAVNGNQVRGEYSLIADVGDLLHSDRHLVAPHSVSYSIDGGPEKTVWSFEQLPGGSSITNYVHDYYVPGYTSGGSKQKRFVVNLGFNQGSNAFPSEPGRHSVRVFVRDYAGNWGSKDYEYNVY